jgi:50S ribosomal subunit-associated GTPase HflX
VLNKSDLLEDFEAEALQRQILLDGGRESVAISAVQSNTLRPLLEKVEEILSRNLMGELKDKGEISSESEAEDIKENISDLVFTAQ